MERSRYVEKRLIYRDSLDIGCVVRKHLERLVRDFLICLHVRPYENRVRAELVGSPRRHCASDAERPCLVGTRRHYSALVRPRADDKRLPAPLGVREQLYRREERIHVDM